MNERPSDPVRTTAPVATQAGGASIRARAMSVVLLASVLALFALSVMQSYSLGQHERMYDNPVYRWRESLAIALSRMQQPPLHGYLAYRSIRNYLNEHGLALMVGEAKTLPTPAERTALVRDTARMNQLLVDASRAPIDPTLPPVILTGNELGLADYYYWAFRIFGLNLNSLVLFYFSVLLVSVVTFFLTFRRSPFCILLLMLYLVAHYFAVNYANIGIIQTIHNSRFFSMLSLLPAMHLLLLLLRRERASAARVTGAVIQAFILFFMLFCRSQAFWQVLAVLFAAMLTLNFRALWQLFRQRETRPQALEAVLRQAWPAVVVAIGLAAFVVYGKWAPNSTYYGSESKSHVFWHVLYVGLISTERELMFRYSYQQDGYSDNLGYLAALHDLRGRNELIPGFAEVADGTITIDVIKNTGAYDRVMRRVFFQVLWDHPRAAFRAFTIRKARDQFEILTHVPPLWDKPAYAQCLALALAASLLAVFAGAGRPRTIGVRTVAGALVIVALCSTITTLMVPTALIVDVFALYFILALLMATYVPLALLSYGITTVIARRRARLHAGASPTSLRP